jgi:hypothetical protein
LLEFRLVVACVVSGLLAVESLAAFNSSNPPGGGLSSRGFKLVGRKKILIG